jgi:hypothetical protein
VCVLRLECGTPGELVDLFLDITRGCSIPAGSVVLIGSLTHLADTGTGAYAEDISKAAAKLGRIFQGGLVVLPGLIVPPGPVTDPVLYQALIDILTWSKTVAKLTESGIQIMDSCFDELVLLLRGAGTGDAQADYGVRLRLPKSLGSSEMLKWDTRGQTGLKSGVGPLTPLQTTVVINRALSDLSNAMGIKKISVAGVYGPPRCLQRLINCLLLLEPVMLGG